MVFNNSDVVSDCVSILIPYPLWIFWVTVGDGKIWCNSKLFNENPCKDLVVATIFIPKRTFLPEPHVFKAPPKPGSNLTLPSESRWEFSL